MSIMRFVRALAPTFQGSKLKDGIILLSERISAQILPQLEKVVSVFDEDWKYHDSTAKQLMEKIEKDVRPKKMAPRACAFARLEYIAKNLQTTLPFVKQEIDRSFGTEVSAIGLTYSRANLLQYVECATFFTSYLTLLINYVSAVELNAVSKRQKLEGVAPPDKERLEAQYVNFSIVCRILGYEVNELKAQLKTVPDMIIDPTTEAEAKLVIGTSKLDPVNFASLPFPLSIILHARLRGVENDVEEYEELKAQANAINYRILLIKQYMENGDGDAALETKLQTLEDRYLEKRRKVVKWEEEHGLPQSNE